MKRKEQKNETSEKRMKIITVNLPQPTIESMRKITDEYGLYPSRSELIRVAVREFLIRQLGNLEKYQEYAESAYERMFSRSGDIDMRTVRFIRNMQQD
jgi:Arc/MetJ-type ribon-helix-helix transcriptional regulator